MRMAMRGAAGSLKRASPKSQCHKGARSPAAALPRPPFSQQDNAPSMPPLFVPAELDLQYVSSPSCHRCEGMLAGFASEEHNIAALRVQLDETPIVDTPMACAIFKEVNPPLVLAPLR